ncbi:hypothetical protein NLG97_g470 [Lecanicillium saksenae]|uniref:Uncharacterized protein n=1 Tax=Lecanicillium saksenae TaxID=468837 RepID=A0ACC1R6M5_9HYPO|nr:hypothetical protein NLG97_g470 [Lecanicillium saksenae]
MTHPHQTTNINGNHYALVELEAPPTRPAGGAGPDSVVFELSGESTVPTQASPQGGVSSAEIANIPQANPWPFYLDDATSTKASLGVRRESDVGTGSNPPPANPWPYHGVESDCHDKSHAADSSHGTVSSSGVDEGPSPESYADMRAGNFAAGLDGGALMNDPVLLSHTHNENRQSASIVTAYQPPTGLDLVPVLVPGQGSAQGNSVLSPESAAAVVPEPLLPATIPDRTHHNIVPNTTDNVVSATLATTTASGNEDSATTSANSRNSAFTTSYPRREDLSSNAPNSAYHTPNQLGLYDNLSQQPTWQPPVRPHSQPPPPYSPEHSATVGFANPAAEIQLQGQYSDSPSTAAPQSFIPPPTPTSYAFSSGQPSSPSSGLRSEAPPLPPRSPRQPKPVVGLSDGPHSSVAFPPPPKRHNVPPARYPPPLPQRPATTSPLPFSSSSKFLGSSSAKKWIEKTNQAIEDTLDAVLQGPAGHPSRPAYVTRPQQMGQQSPQPSANPYNTTRFNSSRGQY